MDNQSSAIQGGSNGPGRPDIDAIVATLQNLSPQDRQRIMAAMAKPEEKTIRADIPVQPQRRPDNYVQSPLVPFQSNPQFHDRTISQTLPWESSQSVGSNTQFHPSRPESCRMPNKDSSPYVQMQPQVWTMSSAHSRGPVVQSSQFYDPSNVPNKASIPRYQTAPVANPAPTRQPEWLPYHFIALTMASVFLSRGEHDPQIVYDKIQQLVQQHPQITVGQLVVQMQNMGFNINYQAALHALMTSLTEFENLRRKALLMRSSVVRRQAEEKSRIEEQKPQAPPSLPRNWVSALDVLYASGSVYDKWSMKKMNSGLDSLRRVLPPDTDLSTINWDILDPPDGQPVNPTAIVAYTIDYSQFSKKIADSLGSGTADGVSKKNDSVAKGDGGLEARGGDESLPDSARVSVEKSIAPSDAAVEIHIDLNAKPLASSLQSSFPTQVENHPLLEEAPRELTDLRKEVSNGMSTGEIHADETSKKRRLSSSTQAVEGQEVATELCKKQKLSIESMEKGQMRDIPLIDLTEKDNEQGAKCSAPRLKYKVYACKFCNCRAELHSLETLMRHIIKLHGGESEGKWRCDWEGCGSECESRGEWIRHLSHGHLQVFKSSLWSAPEPVGSELYVTPVVGVESSSNDGQSVTSFRGYVAGWDSDYEDIVAPLLGAALKII